MADARQQPTRPTIAKRVCKEPRPTQSRARKPPGSEVIGFDRER